ncbi:MAG: dockerin type I repeat-containing protein [Oscillospiraceae bacterium]|nr:dockerin type I repeat-containing protein [Oscillospiraceae bacterium]
MYKKKKIVQSLVAGVLSLGLCAATVPMGVSADYTECDVNHDGVVNITDYYYLRDYLKGNFSVVSPSSLDANQNKIIDSGDLDEIFARCYASYTTAEFIDLRDGQNPVQTIPDEMLAEFEEDELFAASELFPSEEVAEPYVISGPRTYYKYDCTKKTVTSYRLQPELVTQTASLDANEPDSVNDNRVSGYYNANGNGIDGIVRLEYTLDQGNYTAKATGFIVDDYVIATDAKNLWANTGSTIADGFAKVKVQTCDTDGYVEDQTYTVKEIHVPKSYVDNQSSSLTYALLTVSEPLSKHTHFELGVPSTDYLNDMGEDVPLTLSGFPEGVKRDDRVYTSVGYEDSTKPSTEQQLYYTNRCNAGMNGGPVYTVTKIKQNGNYYKIIYTAVGICSNTGSGAGCGSASAVNSFLLMFYKNNPYIGH